MTNKLVQKVFFEEDDIVLEDLGDGVSRKLITYDDRLMLVKVIFEKGAVGAIHHHPHTQISYIEKGIFEVSIDGEKKLLQAGGAFYIPPNIPHGVLCIEAGVLLDSFSPMRDDFIKTK
ncbi:MAG: cupin domain-containing protein [Ferruginibacter sp.]